MSTTGNSGQSLVILVVMIEKASLNNYDEVIIVSQRYGSAKEILCTVQYQVKVLEVTKICRSAINFIDSTEGKNAKQMVAKFLKKAVLFSKNILQKKNSIFVVDEVKLLSSLHTSSKRLLSSHLTTIQHNLRDQHSQGNLEQSHLSNARN